MLPLIPIAGVTLAECAELARALARRIADELRIPTYCYEAAAFAPERKNLAVCRAGEYEALPEKLAHTASAPDFGARPFDEGVARTGATTVGARDFLIAVNFNLNTTSTRRANAIAFDVREKGRPVREGNPITGRVVKDAAGNPVMQPGTLPATKAIGWFIEEYGIERLDPVPFFYKEMRAASYTIDQQMWMRAYNNSEEAMNWLIDLVRDKGVEVFLERDNINDGGPDYAIAFGAGEGEGSASTGQQNAVEAVAKFAEENGVKIQYNVVAKQLVKDESGAVVGVVAQNADESYVEYKGKYVVMATGGFCADKNMVAKYIPQVIPLVGTDPVDVDYNTGFALTGIYAGDGQKMGLWAGASWQKCSAAPIMQGAWSGSNEPLTFHQGLNVNLNTERYQREDVSSPYTANHLLQQPGRLAYGIWTANFAQDVIDTGREFYYFNTRYDVPAATADEVIAKWDTECEKFDTLAELAEAHGLDADKLQAVVDRYNELVDLGEDLDFHKNPDYLVRIDPAGPFYCAMNYPMFMSTEAGLNTNVNAQVCDADDRPIPGLFNVGQMMGNMYANNYNFAIPGMSYGLNCITFGYLLGRDLAAGKF